MNNPTPGRTAEVSRQTTETQIDFSLNLDGSGQYQVETGVGFFDHMLELFSRHAMIDLNVQASGDLDIDAHHTVEDVGIVLGMALEQALGDKKGITRYGFASVPMDEALAQVSIDLSGRGALVCDIAFTSPMIGNFPAELIEEFFRAFCMTGKFNLHIQVPYGTNNHHLAEAVFKAVARALRQAMSLDARQGGVPSTKGTLRG